ncbi:MAG: HAMP domain-containing protein [Spirulinaceae cyanobacterium RM2_2_10]|nr:HAMP domain-containing protein [Spirulinaceae cyanobacterium SM2_1_0]NJO20271.1 HAMP domain-containing protein [Spirulinaceae cyanobacterium RM2_2_10]
MKAAQSLRQAIAHWRRNLTPKSLQVQLTVGIAAMAALGVVAITAGISLHLDHLIVSSHKEQVRNLAQRFEDAVKIYDEMLPDTMVLQKAIDHLSTGDTLIWIEDDNNRITAQSEVLKMGGRADKLLEIDEAEITPDPRLHRVGNDYWVLCGAPLVVQNINLGQVNIAHDTTVNQRMFQKLIGTLTLTSVGVIAVMTLAIALYIRRALHPLQQMRRAAAGISAERLGEDQIVLSHAPSEIDQLAVAFNRMLLRLHDSWQHQRQFVSNVSHELRTPLTLVSGYLQSTLRRATNLSEPQRDALNIAAGEAERTVQLLEDLLNLARADSGYLHFHCTSLALEPFAAEVADMARQYSDRPIHLEVTEPSPIAIADPNRLKQVLINLIDNAVKYSAAGKPVTFKVGTNEQCAEIQICDQGVGIPLSHQARIFERFYRVDDTRCRSTGGVGLGLSIVKTLIEGMGGNVSVRSRPGTGSTFIVTLPLAPSDQLARPLCSQLDASSRI